MNLQLSASSRDKGSDELLLQAQQAEFHFSMDVAGKGQVEGVLWYFPFHNGMESLPLEESNLSHNPITSYNMTQRPTHQQASQMLNTQANQQTQAPGRGAQALTLTLTLMPAIPKDLLHPQSQDEKI